MPADTQVQPQREADIRLGQRWVVILFNDDYHAFDDVVAQVQKATGCDRAQAFQGHLRGAHERAGGRLHRGQSQRVSTWHASFVRSICGPRSKRREVAALGRTGGVGHEMRAELFPIVSPGTEIG